ncbi:MAG: class I SAM-dependent rRNA methyltransferase [Desulfobacterales bacterium]
MAFVTIKPKKEAALVRKHPWIFAGAVARVDGNPEPGQTVDVMGSKGTPFGKGAYSPNSQIRVRMWTFDNREPVDSSFFRSRLERALEARRRLDIPSATTAWRLVNAESDGLPGLIVDCYEDYLVCQFLTLGSDRWREEITTQLDRLLSPAGIYERSDAPVRQKEGLALTSAVVAGAKPPALITVTEGTMRFLVDVRQGHKTGFYIDQRENRAVVSDRVAGKSVLNCFAYTGGFGVAALIGGAARVTNIEVSSQALDLCRRNLDLNGFGEDRFENIEGDVFKVLRSFRDADRHFDAIVLDPPKFTDSKAQVGNASRGYKDINLLAIKLLNPGGLLFTFSCSGLIPSDLFQKIVFDAALDAGKDVRIVQRLAQGADHPTALNFPEASYLKGLVCQVW